MVNLLVAKRENAESFYSELKITRPKSKRDLKNYVKVFLGVDVPDKRICPRHNSPMDYLWHSFSADCKIGTGTPTNNIGEPVPLNGDCVVWANRGGGKTKLAAVETLLDCIFKPNCEVRILGGSGEQAGRMYEYLTGFFDKGFEGFLDGKVLKDKCSFTNNAAVEILTQSARSVRGQHIHKLRCDEVELFDREVFAAAKFTTQSTDGLLAAMEIISTMHRPYGLMQEAVASAEKSGTPIFKWCMWEVIEKCTDRNCSQCPLWGDCGGCAKNAAGYLKIDDCITAMRRSSRACWESEMLCRKPNLENAVFHEFDTTVHVRQIDYDSSLPLYRALDFGFVNPFVCLWIQVDSDGVVRVIDEYVRSRATIDVHAAEMKVRTPCPELNVAGTFCDPAGTSANDVTGTSAVKELRQAGIVTRSRKSGIQEGIELIRASIRAGDGKSRLVISQRCRRLIEAMQCYHYPDNAGQNRSAELPFKDGVYDHPIDALRYFFVNCCQTGIKAQARRY